MQLTMAKKHFCYLFLAIIITSCSTNPYKNTEKVYDQQLKTLENQITSKEPQSIPPITPVIIDTSYAAQLGIIKDTLDIANNKKIEATKIYLQAFFEDLLLHDLNDVKEKIKTEIPAKTFMYFDDTHLRQVLINLIRNAIRHNDPSVDQILIIVFKKEYSICIDVVDYGQGVTKQDISQLFQPFFSTEIDGTGLGLYLSQTICEANQAKLIYVEQKQQGACFRIECSNMD